MMATQPQKRHESIRVGIGGWTYAPWRETFYPADVAQKNELAWASRRVTAIEINGTYYRTQKPESFAKWYTETPDDFVFSLKASRYTTNRRVLAEAEESIARFIGSGIAELGEKLGPIVWQFAPTKVFDPDDFEAFLAMLPKDVSGIGLRHVMDVRHASFMVPEYLALARRYGAATVFTDSLDYPSFADVTGDFVYLRLMRCEPRFTSGYAPKALDQWALRAKQWAQGEQPDNLPRVEAPAKTLDPHQIYVFFINGHKALAPAAAQALLEKLK
jgi:uncharacterized protein YecE (DUF72 family)